MKQPATPVSIRQSDRAKRLRLRVKPGLIELVVPRGTAKRQAMAFLESHRAWAEAKLLEFSELSRKLPAQSGFSANPTLPWRGREIPLLILEQPDRKIRITVEESVQISLPTGLGENLEATAYQAFHLWTKSWLRSQVAALAAHHAGAMGLHPREIRIKRMKTRWGSCGPRNDININWLLALAPEAVLEYVVVHELCHIAIRNHSQAFWSMVADHFPNHRSQRQWLKAHGSELMRRFDL